MNNLKPPPTRKLWGRWHGIFAVTEGADVSDIANLSYIIVKL